MKRLHISCLLAGLCLVLISCAADQSRIPDSPAGNQSLLLQLQAELARQLDAAADRGFSDVTGVYVTTLGCTDDGSDCNLSWTYNNTGDYDQNSETNAADLTQIVLNFGCTSASPGWPFACVADGDSNGEVNAADITPIAMNFLSTVNNYVVECDSDGAGDWRPVANVAFNAGAVPPGSGGLVFGCTVANGMSLPGSGVERFRVSAGPEADPLFEIPVPEWEATVYGTPDSGFAPLSVYFTIEFTGDPGPFEATLDYGVGGDWYFGVSPDGSALDATYVFETAGTFHVTGNAINTGPTGGVVPISCDIVVDEYTGSPLVNPSNWERYDLESGSMWGAHSTAALVGGKPALLYTRDDTHEIYYSRATVDKPATLADWVTVLVDDGGDRGGTLDLIDWNGYPCAVYEDTVGQDIYFAIADDMLPVEATPWQIHEIDVMGLNSPQLGVYLGTPIVVYITGSGIRYAESTAGTVNPPMSDADWQLTDIDTDGFMSYPQIQTVGGEVLVAYQRADAGWKELRYSWYDGMSWTMTVVDDLNKNSGNTVRMTIEGGKPVIAYQNVDIVSYLRMAQAVTFTPVNDTDWTTMTVRQEAQTHIGNWLGLAWYENRPFMCYVNTGSGAEAGLQVSYPTTDTPAGPADFEHGLLDDAAGYFVNEETNALVLPDGTLALVYRTSEGLQFTYYNGP